MTDYLRHNRHRASQFSLCAASYRRHKRHTPLEGVTVVTATSVTSDVVPMPPFATGRDTGSMTVALSLPKKSGENAHG